MYTSKFIVRFATFVRFARYQSLKSKLRLSHHTTVSATIVATIIAMCALTLCNAAHATTSDNVAANNVAHDRRVIPIKITTIVSDDAVTSNAATAARSATQSPPPPKSSQYPEDRPWSGMLFVGTTALEQLGTLIRGEYTSAGETLYSAELAYTLHQDNLLRKFLRPMVGAIQVASSITYRDEHRNTTGIAEGDVYLVLRWIDWPWDKYITMTFAAAEGISYTSRVPYVEVQDPNATGSSRLLNYLMFEVTFALPAHPEWQLVGRIHHRSTAYGIFGNTNGGSNTVGLGLRYYF